ncbi:MAG: hypothetical protein C5B60_00090 [Chloroflexi bacterium]|nr:MAG: hypothetical protein C5B60_00090 [Chloroflexota bacterium]
MMAQVRVYPPGQPQMGRDGIVITVAESGNSIAVTLLPEERHICARRESEAAPWIDVETDQPVEIAA